MVLSQAARPLWQSLVGRHRGAEQHKPLTPAAVGQYFYNVVSFEELLLLRK